MKRLPVNEAIFYGWYPDVRYEINVMITGENDRTEPMLTGWIADESETRLTTSRVSTKLNIKWRR